MNRCRSSDNDVPKLDVVRESIGKIESPPHDDGGEGEPPADLIKMVVEYRFIRRAKIATRT